MDGAIKKVFPLIAWERSNTYEQRILPLDSQEGSYSCQTGHF